MTIDEIKNEITNLGPMLPGILTQQMVACGKSNCRCANGGEKHGPYWQLSWTIGRKSGTKYVKERDLAEVRKRIKTYMKFQELVSALLKASTQLDIPPPKVDDVT